VSGHFARIALAAENMGFAPPCSKTLKNMGIRAALVAPFVPLLCTKENEKPDAGIAGLLCS
jgi:hypothetical protein